jgi:hypothetical protein
MREPGVSLSERLVTHLGQLSTMSDQHYCPVRAARSGSSLSSLRGGPAGRSL